MYITDIKIPSVYHGGVTARDCLYIICTGVFNDLYYNGETLHKHTCISTSNNHFFEQEISF